VSLGSTAYGHAAAERCRGATTPCAGARARGRAGGDDADTGRAGFGRGPRSEGEAQQRNFDFSFSKYFPDFTFLFEIQI
jgi:hypothetical protein